jgi:hypothetical protein
MEGTINFGTFKAKKINGKLCVSLKINLKGFYCEFLKFKTYFFEAEL